MDFENGIRTDQIIDVEANEKRKRATLDQTHRVRSRIDDSPGEESQATLNPQGFAPSQPNVHSRPQVHLDNPPNDGTVADRSNAQAPDQAPANTTTNKLKFRLASKLNQTVTTEDVG